MCGNRWTTQDTIPCMTLHIMTRFDEKANTKKSNRKVYFCNAHKSNQVRKETDKEKGRIWLSSQIVVEPSERKQKNTSPQASSCFTNTQHSRSDRPTNNTKWFTCHLYHAQDSPDRSGSQFASWWTTVPTQNERIGVCKPTERWQWQWNEHSQKVQTGPLQKFFLLKQGSEQILLFAMEFTNLTVGSRTRFFLRVRGEGHVHSPRHTRFVCHTLTTITSVPLFTASDIG